MNCHSCDVTALGCSGCDANHTGLTTHGYLSLGFGSPILSSKTVLHEFILHLSAGLLAEDSPLRAKIDESLAKGTLSRFSRCVLSAAIQKLAGEVLKESAPNALPRLDNILLEDEEAKARARKEAEAAARARARDIAKETAEATARQVATEVARLLAPPEAAKAAVNPAREKATEVATAVAKSIAREAAEPPATETATRVATKIATNIARHKMEELETKQRLDDFVRHQLSSFKHIPQEKFRESIDKASKNAPAVTRKFNIPQQLAIKVPQLALYDFILICDNSGSMTQEHSRIPTLRATVCGTFRILADLGSDRPFSIIPYTGDSYKSLGSEADVKQALDSIHYGGGGNASMPLQQTILPLLEDQAKRNQLNPTVVVVITDGDVGDVSKFGTRISLFRSVLRNNDYEGPAVLFLICRVGSDGDAAEKLKNLKKHKDIRDVILYSEDQLDSKLTEMQNNIDAYTGYVMGKLLDAMQLHLIQI